VALFAEDAVVASPVVLKARWIILRLRQTVRMEALATKIARKEILLVAKRPTKVAHLHKDQRWIIEANLDWVRVPVAISIFVVFEFLNQLQP